MANTIDIISKEWFDKVNGNSYFAGTITVDYKTETEETFLMPFQYGYGSQHEQEAKIIAEAGKIGSITIATNMAGRGTDIQLGGNKDFRDEDNQKELPQIKEDKEKVKSIGGLYIVGTERHESRRIDNQLRGSAGRQGDSGTYQF